MVTHNPDLAEKYSSRIIKILEGKITDDSNPYNKEEEEKEDRTTKAMSGTIGYTKELKDMGLDGIEVYYPYKRHRGIIKFHSRHNIKALADKYDLIITGGTDEHGSLIKQ